MKVSGGDFVVGLCLQWSVLPRYLFRLFLLVLHKFVFANYTPTNPRHKGLIHQDSDSCDIRL